MRKWFWLIALVAVFALAAAAIACGDDGAAPAGETPEEETPVTGETPAAGELSVSLEEVGGSGARGAAVLTETADGTTEVDVEMRLSPGAHPNHLHHGTCEAQGEIHVTLEELDADATGDTTGTTTDFPEEDPDPEFSHWTDRDHYLAVHDADGTVISCGNVPS